jgi:hypothetical protein
MRRWVGAAVVFAAAVALGCSDDGPKRHRLSGAVKYAGEPIPFGDVVFTPDGSKKNSGPQGFANIRDGKYDTSADGGKGIGGGPTVVRVTGFSGPGGKLLCEVELRMDLPADGGTLDIDVPRKDEPVRKKGPEI